ncbi:hypothetical protein NLX71_21860 [Paenibacillus sp. MZ04-78.2]|uniref:hypothetical protein n=1 Tax=Paenibacillus sp. MZ04-78.2 TaxID=2962034 RepID=UPI0020B88445|nr:hypothetical protein [Paenibacillus sp. MZ04-78.2]MCP3775920.1 hypothetical protein [Paenibacillus sp. MZ04-78.2]
MTLLNVRRMLVRKLAAAYFTSWAIVLWLTFPSIALGGSNWNAAENYLLLAFIIALYAVPAIFLYGVLVSSLLEALSVKLKVKGPGGALIFGFLHAIFGLCFGFVLQSSLFGIMGGGAAILFYSFDRILIRAIPILKRKIRVIAFIAPMLLFVLIVGAIDATSPPKPPKLPFTAKDAVQFATSGRGTTIDRFPKEEGVVKLQIDGYDVERETKVEETAEKEVYKVLFTERWRKGEENGQYQMIYEVSRGSMEVQRGNGAEPPYLRPAKAA